MFQVDGDLLRNTYRFGAAPGQRGRGDAQPRTRVGRYVDRLPMNVVAEGTTVRIPDTLAYSADAAHEDLVARIGIRSRVGTPLLRDGEAIGCLVVDRTEARPFTDAQVALLETFADQAVIAIENTRLVTELQDSNRALTEQKQHLQEALEQQTATADILRAIASAPTGLEQVLDAVAKSAGRLCEARDVHIARIVGGRLSQGGVARAGRGHWCERRPRHVTGGVGGPRGRRTLRLRPSGNAERSTCPTSPRRPARHFRTRARGVRFGYRTIAATPLLRSGEAIGAITIRRPEARPFSPAQIALLETLADQAVIALETARLFQELQQRLEEQTATGQLLRVIASSPADLHRVLDAVAESAARVCGADDALIFRLDGEAFERVAHFGPLRSARPGIRTPMSRNWVVARPPSTGRRSTSPIFWPSPRRSTRAPARSSRGPASGPCWPPHCSSKTCRLAEF